MSGSVDGVIAGDAVLAEEEGLECCVAAGAGLATGVGLTEGVGLTGGSDNGGLGERLVEREGPASGACRGWPWTTASRTMEGRGGVEVCDCRCTNNNVSYELIDC